MVDIPDHPVIRNLERTGYPDGQEPQYPICPICKQVCEAVYKDNDGNIVGCDEEFSRWDAWEEPECFPEKE